MNSAQLTSPQAASNQALSSLETSPTQKTGNLTHSVDEVAVTLGVSKHTVYRLLDRKLLKALPGLRVKRITDASVKRYVAE